MISHLAQPPGHSRLYSFIRGSPGPVVVLLVGDVDVDGVVVLASPLTRGEHAQPGHGGLLLCRANCLTQGPAARLLCQPARKLSPIFLPFSLSTPGVGEPGGGTFI